VAQVAMGGNDAHTLKAFHEAASYPGPSLIISYTHCIAHGIDMSKGLDQQKLAVETGHWPLFRFDPRRAAEGLNPFQLDSRRPSRPLKDYIYNETRYRMLTQSKPEVAAAFLEDAQQFVLDKWQRYEDFAREWTVETPEAESEPAAS
jgi:pyruvate-ferredoxin/flavodoxin oxidoreductase